MVGPKNRRLDCDLTHHYADFFPLMTAATHLTKRKRRPRGRAPNAALGPKFLIKLSFRFAGDVYAARGMEASRIGNQSNGRNRACYRSGGIGERHDDPWARRFVIDCLQGGIVRHLFLELPRSGQRAVDLVTAATQINVARAMISGACGYSQSPGNPVQLADLIVEAKAANIPVWAADSPSMANRRTTFEDRHNCVRLTYLEKSRGGNGCLLLWGKDHFTDDDHPLTDYIPELTYYNFTTSIENVPGPPPPPLPPRQPRR